ncbi:zinc finger protein 184-like [Periophthalmus magnuspinnatus]|uniref:zinc finger protein 184-like n=1 Tax=Periophthalmus magnuspinnatus TaxID=409849 RepID=UPI00145C1433|nr:zinc finger protein 184-like [Periophthalmus magnuspinnatus]
MSKVEALRALVNLRLNAAAEEIFALFERTIAEYEEEVRRSKAENQRKHEPKVLLIFKSPSASPGLIQGLKHQGDSTQCPQVRHETQEPETEEPEDTRETEEQSVKQEDEPLPVSLSRVCEKTRESSFQPGQTENREETRGQDTREQETWGPDAWRRDTWRQHAQRLLTGGQDARGQEIQGQDTSAATHLQLKTERDTGMSSASDLEEDWTAPLSCSDAQMDTEAFGHSNHQVHIGDTAAEDSDLSPEPRTSGDVSKRKKHQCYFCQKIFKSKKGLQRHIRIHTGDKPYSCPVCDRRFAQLSGLTVHKRTHTQEQPYSCSVCMKKFSQSCNLQRHMRIHTGERPYSCPVCKKGFILKLSRDRHVGTHSKQKPSDHIKKRRSKKTKDKTPQTMDVPMCDV